MERQPFEHRAQLTARCDGLSVWSEGCPYCCEVQNIRSQNPTTPLPAALWASMVLRWHGSWLLLCCFRPPSHPSALDPSFAFCICCACLGMNLLSRVDTYPHTALSTPPRCDHLLTSSKHTCQQQCLTSMPLRWCHVSSLAALKGGRYVRDRMPQHSPPMSLSTSEPRLFCHAL